MTGMSFIEQKVTLFPEVVGYLISLPERVACSEHFAKRGREDGVDKLFAKNLCAEVIHSAGVVHQDGLFHYSVAHHGIKQVEG